MHIYITIYITIYTIYYIYIYYIYTYIYINTYIYIYIYIYSIDGNCNVDNNEIIRNAAHTFANIFGKMQN